jgi:two-component system, response regulator YesN
MLTHYQVFLVEDEIVIRDAIRNNVNWAETGCAFAGEAPDGEIALPLILAAAPDILITDIRMPFMDGLELARLVRQSLPGIKIIILSGYDEFQYAQQAIKLGVTEYLLKPIGAQELELVLRKIVGQLEKERGQQAQLDGLKHQVADSLSIQREKFLLRLLVDATSTSDAIEKGRQLGLDLVSRFYLVMFLRARDSRGESAQDVYAEFQKAAQVVANLVGRNPDIIPIQKDIDEFVLILKGKHGEQLYQDAYYLAETIREQVEGSLNSRLAIGISPPFERLRDWGPYFAEAVESAGSEKGNWPLEGNATPFALLQVDDAAILQYLKLGDPADYDAFFDRSIAPLDKAPSRIFLNYITINTTLAAARYISILGGAPRQILPNLDNFEAVLPRVRSLDEARKYIREVTTAAIGFRGRQANRQAATLIQKSKEYLETHFAEAELSLNDVSQYIGLNPSHLSFIFKRETGETFKNYLTNLRIERAKELLRSTDQSSAEISERVGYNDPHYFSVVFKKITGVRPNDFRFQKGCK